MFFEKTLKVWTRPSSYSIRPVAEREKTGTEKSATGATVPSWVLEVGVRSKRSREEVRNARKI